MHKMILCVRVCVQSVAGVSRRVAIFLKKTVAPDFIFEKNDGFMRHAPKKKPSSPTMAATENNAQSAAEATAPALAYPVMTKREDALSWDGVRIIILRFHVPC